MRTASQPSGTRTKSPTPATISAVRQRRFDSELSAMLFFDSSARAIVTEAAPRGDSAAHSSALGFEQRFDFADEVERARDEDEFARRRLRARDRERVRDRR